MTYVPPAVGVNAQPVGSAAVVTSHRPTVSVTHSPTISATPFRSRCTWCHSRRAITPRTITPATFSPVGRTASTANDCGAPAVQK
jgi:cytochrome c2